MILETRLSACRGRPQLLLLGADNRVWLAVLDSLSKQYVSRTLLRVRSSTKLENPSDRRFAPKCYGPFFVYMFSLNPRQEMKAGEGERSKSEN